MTSFDEMDATIKKMRRAKWGVSITSRDGGGFTASFHKSVEVGRRFRFQQAIAGEADGRTMPEAVVKAAKNAKDHEAETLTVS